MAGPSAAGAPRLTRGQLTHQISGRSLSFVKVALAWLAIAVAPGHALAQDGGFLRISRVVANEARGAEPMILEKEEISGTFWVEKEALLTERDVARASIVEKVPIRVLLEFTPEGRKRFAAVCREMSGKSIAIVVDATLLSAPLVQEEITGPSIELFWTRPRPEAERFLRRINKP